LSDSTNLLPEHTHGVPENGESANEPVDRAAEADNNNANDAAAGQGTEAPASEAYTVPAQELPAEQAGAGTWQPYAPPADQPVAEAVGVSAPADVPAQAPAEVPPPVEAPPAPVVATPVPDAPVAETAAVEPVTAPPARGTTGLTSLRLSQLQEIAGRLGITGTGRMRKGDLIAAIESHQGGGVTVQTGQTELPMSTDNAPTSTAVVAAPTTEPVTAPTAEPAAAPAADQAAPAADGDAPAGQRTRRRRASRPAGSPEQGADGAAATDAKPAEKQVEKTDKAEKTDKPAEKGDKPDQGGRDRGESGGQSREDRGGRGDRGDRDQGGRDRDQGGRDQGGRDQGGRDQGGRDQGGRDQGGRDQGGRDQGGRGDRGDRDQGGRDRNGRDDGRDNEGGGRRRRGRFRDRRNRRDRDRYDQEPVVTEDDVLVPVAGILDVLDNYAFIRTSGYLTGPTDVYVSLSQVRKNGLRRGDAITGAVRQPKEGERRDKYNALVRLDTVNGVEPEQSKSRPEFTKLTPLYPQDRLRLETEPTQMTQRVIDLVMPIGKGQRALIVSPPKAGKTMVLQAIANAITKNNPECHLMVVLVDERPEEVTDMQRSVKGEVIASTFDRPPSDHTTVAELSIERAKRLVELGHDVVVLLDSITRLGRAYNLAAPASGRILSGGVDSTALYPPKRFLGAARNIEHGGSLTILATALIETGSTMDTVIFEEFKGTGNAELVLSRKIADKRVFPAVDVIASGTRKEEILLAPEEMVIVHKLRRVLNALDPQQALDLVLDRLKNTRTNVEFLMQVSKTTVGPSGE
jgi:transcription termination factor Rho